MSSANEEWPASLKRYDADGTGTLRFVPERWGSGQLTLFIGGIVCMLIGVLALILGQMALLSGLAFCAFGLALGAGPLLDRGRWFEVRPSGATVSIREGRWRWSRRSLDVKQEDLQTVLIADDEKTYGFRVPLLRHLRIEFRAAPFAGAPTAIVVGEMFGLSDTVLGQLRQLILGASSNAA
jgi:hypothetical protein